MSNSDIGYYLENKAKQLFYSLVSYSIRRRFISSFFTRRDESILDLKTLTDIVPVSEEYQGTIQDVKTDRIIGTESRSQDFIRCFYPRKNWMAGRWVKIYTLMHSEGIPEPLKLIEYGGYYFVRDGNHRVSVAIHSGIEYLTAEIIHYRIPITLPDNLSRNNLELFSEKYQFHKRTQIFNFVKESNFQVNCPQTWKKLETEIFEHSRSWFVRFYGREPVNNEEFIRLWTGFYKISVEHIRERSLLLFFPGMRETDVFVELVEYWNSYQNPDSFWVGEIYEKFEHYIGKKRAFLRIRRFFYQTFRMLTVSAEDAKFFFLHSTRLMKIIPEFIVPMAGRDFFNLCYKQIFRINAKLLIEKSRKQPTLKDIDRLWYEAYYKPVLERYRNVLYPVKFEKFYKKFSGRYYNKIITGNAEVEKCLDEFEKKMD